MAIIEFIDRDVNAKKPAVKPEVAAAKAEEAVATEATEEKKVAKAPKADKPVATKATAKEPAAKKATAEKKTVAVKRRATGK